MSEVWEKKKNKFLFIVSVCIIGVLTCLTVAFAQEVPSTAQIDYQPNVSAVLIDSNGGTLQVNSADTAVFNCTGTITDLDGYADIVGANATFFGYGYNSLSPDTTGAKYTNNSCLLYGGSNNVTNFACTVMVHHHTINGTWQCNVSANDTYGVIGTGNASNTVDVFKSIGVPTDVINFGSYASGGNSGTNDFTLVVNNTGNSQVNVTLDAYPISGSTSNVSSMSCTIGSLPVSAIRYSLSSGVTATLKNPLTDLALTAEINLVPTSLGSVLYTSTSLYFGIVIPSSGQSGICTGYLDVSAI